MTAELLLSFPHASEAERTRLVRDLKENLERIPEIHDTSIKRDSDEAMDAGAILSIVLGAPAVIAFVHAVEAWLKRRNQTSITIETADKKILVKNLRSEDSSEVVKELESLIAKS